jgi:hypothetical protein
MDRRRTATTPTTTISIVAFWASFVADFHRIHLVPWIHPLSSSRVGGIKYFFGKKGIIVNVCSIIRRDVVGISSDGTIDPWATSRARLQKARNRLSR